jgi:hypothetical protein
MRRCTANHELQHEDTPAKGSMYVSCRFPVNDLVFVSRLSFAFIANLNHFPVFFNMHISALTLPTPALLRQGAAQLASLDETNVAIRTLAHAAAGLSGGFAVGGCTSGVDVRSGGRHHVQRRHHQSHTLQSASLECVRAVLHWPFFCDCGTFVVCPAAAATGIGLVAGDLNQNSRPARLCDTLAALLRVSRIVMRCAKLLESNRSRRVSCPCGHVCL